MVDFYKELETIKAKRKLKYSDLGNIINIKPDAFRMAMKRKSFSELEKKEILKKLKNEQNEQKNIISEQIQEYNKRVPFYDLDVTASNIVSFDDVTELAEYDIDFKPFNDCIALLPIVGDSMYPEFKNGDIIAIKEAPTTHIMYGETHLIITKGGYRTVKKLRRHSDQDKIILKPVNPNYDEDEIFKNDIIKLYLVKGQFKTHTY